MPNTYTQKQKLIGYSDSAVAGGRIGRSAFALFVDFAKVGAPAATGLVVTDIIDDIGGLPENCVVRTVVAQVVKPITVLTPAGTNGITAIPLVLKGGSTTLATFALGSLNGNDKGGHWVDVSLSDGGTGVAGTKNDLSLTVGAVTNGADTPAATAITGGVLMLIFFVDYIPETDELAALFDSIDEVSDGGNNATELEGIGTQYS